MSLPSLAPASVSSVVPAVAAHRGASGRRPEHTLGAYREAIAAGCDDIELDLVVTADGVLVARHEAELSATTDVATRPDFADRRTTRAVDGVEQTGWFAEDLTLAELRRLTTRERMPLLRPANTLFDGIEPVPTLDEVLDLVTRESARRGRPVGVLAELKHAAHARAAGVPLEDPLLETLARHGLDHPWSRVSVMSFETDVLRRLATLTRLPLVQLIDHAHLRPPDLRALGEPTTYADLVTPAGLDRIDEYADGIGPHKSWVLTPGADGRIVGRSGLVRAAHSRGLTVHAWTLRAENRYLPLDFRIGTDPGAPGDLAAEVRALLAAGVDGLITDHPDLALAGLDERNPWPAPHTDPTRTVVASAPPSASPWPAR